MQFDDKHVDFIDKYNELLDEFKNSGPTEKLVNKILTVVMGWLKDHIVQVDGKYAKYVKECS